MKTFATLFIILSLAVPAFSGEMRNVTVYEIIINSNPVGDKIAGSELKAAMYQFVKDRGSIYKIVKKKKGVAPETEIIASQEYSNITFTNTIIQSQKMGKLLMISTDWVVQSWEKVSGFKDIKETKITISIPLNDYAEKVLPRIRQQQKKEIQKYLEQTVQSKFGFIPESYSGQVLIIDIPQMMLQEDKIIYTFKIKARVIK